jgi:serine/threonine protein kinase/CHASE1-domain containing sensor protein
VTSGGARSPYRFGQETGRFTWRRVRSAFGSWRASIKARDVVMASLIFLLSLGLGGYMLSRAQTAAHLAFANEAQHLLGDITEKLSEPSEDLLALKTFFEVSGALNRGQFRRLTAPMLQRHITVYALEWLPLVRDADRDSYEHEARAAGLTDYRFWEAGPDGKPRTASRRPFYVPVHYMEPPKAMALGFDIAAEPERWSNADHAGTLGKVTVSPPFSLVEDAGKPDASAAIGMYAPVYNGGDPETEAARRESLLGFAMAIFRVAPLVDAASSAARSSGLAFALRDTDAPGEPLLAEWPREEAKLARRRGFDLKMPLPFKDRHWMLEAFPLPGAFRPARRTPIGVGIAGVLVSLLGFVIVTSLRTISRLRRQAERVGPYRLVARLGQGAMGVVWEARHALLRRPTAVKLLAPGTGGERALARFEREVQLTASLTHPSTIAIYDYGRNADGIFYYAMERLHGINLVQLVAFEGPLPAARVVHLLRQACGALTEAHAAGLIHRDIKPANLMVCVYGGIPDFLKVLDFGLVKDVGAVEPAAGRGPERETDQVELSQDGSLLGTPLYMAPEGMSDPGGVDRRADLFSLGAVGYFLLTGGSPFPGRTAIEVFAMERKGPPKPLPKGPPNPVPACLDAAIRSCLSFAREERPASAEALDATLDACAIDPPWTRADARRWWEEKGPEALESARTRRDEEDSSKVLVLASDGRTQT